MSREERDRRVAGRKEEAAESTRPTAEGNEYTKVEITVRRHVDQETNLHDDD